MMPMKKKNPLNIAITSRSSSSNFILFLYIKSLNKNDVLSIFISAPMGNPFPRSRMTAIYTFERERKSCETSITRISSFSYGQILYGHQRGTVYIYKNLHQYTTHTPLLLVVNKHEVGPVNTS